MIKTAKVKLDENLCLWDVNIDTSWDLPARFDWSIMGCTILLLALINLKENREVQSQRSPVQFLCSVDTFVRMLQIAQYSQTST